ncbi:hypothetical protein, partial [Pseudomonas aeruginosa]|uniref:hypothetical protein n=1 Tax=Pseudomonas aeruginosa TaxID=287 RepID=UPI001ABCD865
EKFLKLMTLPESLPCFTFFLSRKADPLIQPAEKLQITIEPMNQMRKLHPRPMVTSSCMMTVWTASL